MEGACGDEAKVEGRRRRWHHEKRVLHGHEEEKPQCEQARHPMVRHHVDSVSHGPFHERRTAGVLGRGRLPHGSVCYLNAFSAVGGSCLMFAPVIEGGLSAAIHDRWISFFVSAEDI